MADLLALALDAAARRHLAWALEAHARRCRDNGHRLPPALADLRKLVTGGHERTTLGPDDDMPHDGAVFEAPLLLTFAETGQRLAVSERTVRRLVAAGELPAVEVGGRRRVHVLDLAQYALDLRRTTVPA